MATDPKKKKTTRKKKTTVPKRKSKGDRFLEKKLDKRRKIIGKPKTRLA